MGNYRITNRSDIIALSFRKRAHLFNNAVAGDFRYLFCLYCRSDY